MQESVRSALDLYDSLMNNGTDMAQQKGTLADQMFQVRWCQVMSFTGTCAA